MSSYYYSHYYDYSYHDYYYMKDPGERQSLKETDKTSSPTPTGQIPLEDSSEEKKERPGKETAERV